MSPEAALHQLKERLATISDLAAGTYSVIVTDAVVTEHNNKSVTVMV